MRAGWGVYCKDGHGCVGIFDTELEALELAMKMMDDERAMYGGETPCLYDSIPMTLADAAAPEVTDTVHPKGGYL
jgi:hypothetical protein